MGKMKKAQASVTCFSEDDVVATSYIPQYDPTFGDLGFSGAQVSGYKDQINGNGLIYLINYTNWPDASNYTTNTSKIPLVETTTSIDTYKVDNMNIYFYMDKGSEPMSQTNLENGVYRLEYLKNSSDQIIGYNFYYAGGLPSNLPKQAARYYEVNGLDNPNTELVERISDGTILCTEVENTLTHAKQIKFTYSNKTLSDKELNDSLNIAKAYGYYSD